MSLVVSDLTKRFRDVTAVDGLSFTVREGVLFGFLGPNGAGKTTTMRTILGILRPDAGTVTWKGGPIHRLGSRFYGYLPEERGLYPKMRVAEHLEFLGRIHGLDRPTARRETARWLQRFALEEVRNKRIEELSKGNQQKVQTIGTMLHDPELLILDEPFAGLDPVNASLLKEVLLEAQQQGKTIIFSSHRMDQVEEICQDIALINRGRLLLHGNLRQIKKSMGRQILRLSLEGNWEFWAKIPGLQLLEERTDYREFLLGEGVDPNHVLAEAMEAGQVIRFELVEPSLDQIFVEKVGEGA
ncbi:MAG TPA: ATP-binding cassette domain-containing protein [Firmicutes bacterium]|jgi:ABC-2 type transport system ATP-binding protein|nr:ATP-binding cassette domain-containing protein [Bacillota bacterium]HHT43035.1 ATP-binding cassette domain-containing protein [Bacillota bacterium]